VEEMRKSKIFLLLIVIMLLINVASAMVSDIVITPKNPVVGDDITIKARTDQSNELIKIIFEKKVPVENGKYSFEIRRLNIPMESCFVATAKDVTTLKAKVTWWIAQVTKNGNLEGNGVTRLSQCHVPPLTYNIKIDGSTEKKSQVLLQFSASSNLPANKGKIEYRYDSQGMPTGDYLVKIGDVTKTLTLRDEKEKDKERDEKEKDKERDERLIPATWQYQKRKKIPKQATPYLQELAKHRGMMKIRIPFRYGKIHCFTRSSQDLYSDKLDQHKWARIIS
jgi:hypothetical protein